MTETNAPSEVSALVEQLSADLSIPNPQQLGVPREISDAVTAAGFQASIGTIAFAGQYSNGGFAVQYNNETGGFSSTWPQWAFALAKDALLGNRRVWVASNGDPFGANLVFVMIMP
jgi:hypothetical protein